MIVAGELQKLPWDSAHYYSVDNIDDIRMFKLGLHQNECSDDNIGLIFFRNNHRAGFRYSHNVKKTNNIINRNWSYFLCGGSLTTSLIVGVCVFFVILNWQGNEGDNEVFFQTIASR